jgi:hypothetical protein
VGLWLRDGVVDDGRVLRVGVGEAARLGPLGGVALGVCVGPQLGIALGWLGLGLGAAARLPADGADRDGLLPHEGIGSDETVPGLCGVARDEGGVRPVCVRPRLTDSRCVAGERRAACGSITVT